VSQLGVVILVANEAKNTSIAIQGDRE